MPLTSTNASTAEMPEGFQIGQGYASYDPVGVVSLDRAAELVAQAITYARQQNIKLLLVDTRQLRDMLSPTLDQRYFIARNWATASGGAVKVALVLERYLIDPEHFGIQVAINFGMRANVFDSRTEALAWLLDPSKPKALIPMSPTK